MHSTGKSPLGQRHDGRFVGSGFSTPEFTEGVRLNQQKLSSNLRRQYDFIVCGSGSSGSVVARYRKRSRQRAAA